MSLANALWCLGGLVLGGFGVYAYIIWVMFRRIN